MNIGKGSILGAVSCQLVELLDTVMIYSMIKFRMTTQSNIIPIMASPPRQSYNWDRFPPLCPKLFLIQQVYGQKSLRQTNCRNKDWCWKQGCKSPKIKFIFASDIHYFSAALSLRPQTRVPFGRKSFLQETSGLGKETNYSRKNINKTFIGSSGGAAH